MSYNPNDPVFDKGLEFGNLSQIQYLKDWNTALAIIEQNTEDGLIPYKVEVTREFRYDMEVWAKDEKDAIKNANYLLDVDFYDFDDCDTSYYVRLNFDTVGKPEDEEKEKDEWNMSLDFG